MANALSLTLEPKVTILEARKTLGRNFEHLTDYQVQLLINFLSHLARKTLDI